jgi:hypothetical protein
MLWRNNEQTPSDPGLLGFPERDCVSAWPVIQPNLRNARELNAMYDSEELWQRRQSSKDRRDFFLLR